MIDKLKGRGCMIWSFMQNARMYEALRDYGDRLETVGIFTFEVDSTGTITETGTPISTMLTYIEKWPHINWLLTVMNHGTASIFTALRENTDGAKDMFLTELVRIMEKYPWCSGVDIDLERGGEYVNKDLANSLFEDIYTTVKSYDSSKLVNICLPGMTSVNGSVGGENWCVYEDLNNYCDTASIMSYGMAWAGSAPGPVSPTDWLVGTYDYASSVMDPQKIYLGLPAYGWNWQIYDEPENLGKTYRGTSNTYYAAMYWMTGAYNFTDDNPEQEQQPYIPILAYWDDYDKVPYAFPQVYDFMEGQDSSYDGNLIGDVYNRRRYLTCYGKTQKTEFENTVIDQVGGDLSAYTGVVTVSDSVITLGDEGTATYSFDLSSSGNYDIAIRICYPFWDKNGLIVSLDGESHVFSESRLWWPYWRKTCWLTLAKDKYLSSGTHTIVISGAVNGVQFYGFRVCNSFNEYPKVGTANFTMHPRQFLDINKEPCEPVRGFKLTSEVLRRKSDSALIWYEDFRDDPPIPSSYYTTLSGEFEVWQEELAYGSTARPYSQLDGYGEIAWNYNSFSDIHIRASIGFPSSGNGRAGIFVGDVFCCFNIDAQTVELYQGTSLLGSYSTTFSKTSDANLRTNPSMYTIEMRIRGTSVRVYSGSSNTLRFTANISATSGYAGFRSDNRAICQLLRLGDAWVYEPYERFDVTFAGGTVTTFGRIERSNTVWDNEFEVFTLTSDIEEYQTRSESISLDYEFYHSHVIDLTCGEDYIVKVEPKDINIWLSRLFLGDADGFSILYYQDVDSLIYWANEAAYRWKLKGIAIWSLGQEDMRLWEVMPLQN